MNEKIRASHLRRRVLVYVRQSTTRQVLENVESTDRQYGLVDRASSLGWPSASIEVIDEDLGQSGASVEWRPGFKRMAEQVTQGKVGAILGLDVSRFARSSADWHRLLELCRWADVLIIDEQGIFDPADRNDGLLLGFKGQMSEAEKNWLKLRMHGARLNKPRRGALKVMPPSGYVWDPATSRLRMDPDIEVQHAIELVFRRFRVEGSALATVRYFQQHDLLFPIRRAAMQSVEWRRLRPSTVVRLLRSPIYTGTYVYGRREDRAVLADGKLRGVRTINLPEHEWKVCLHDQHPGYIRWEEYVENVNRLRENHMSWEAKGAPGEGPALLQGLAICGKCGGRMTVGYGPGGKTYMCRSAADAGRWARRCWGVTGERIEDAVVAAFLQVAQPPELDLALAVTQEAERQADDLDAQWRLRLERARYEARMAERRYLAVDPENRNVASTVEAEWERRLRELGEVERGYEAARKERKVQLSDADRARVRELANDLPAVWNALSTSVAQRKNLLRTLIVGVTLTPIDVPTRQTQVQILWEGGAVTELRVDRPRWATALPTPQGAETTIRRLVGAGLTDEAIARQLNEMEARTGLGRVWTERRVALARRNTGIESRPRPAPTTNEAGLTSTRGVAERFGVSTSTVTNWTRMGVLTPVVAGARGNTAWYQLNDAVVRRLERHRRRVGSARSRAGRKGEAS